MPPADAELWNGRSVAFACAEWLGVSCQSLGLGAGKQVSRALAFSGGLDHWRSSVGSSMRLQG